MAFMKPSRIGLDSRSATSPSRARPISNENTPDKTASMPTRATACSTLPAASGTVSAAITGASVESGPSTMMRLGPNTAYAISGTMVAYKP